MNLYVQPKHKSQLHKMQLELERIHSRAQSWAHTTYKNYPKIPEPDFELPGRAFYKASNPIYTSRPVKTGLWPGSAQAGFDPSPKVKGRNEFELKIFRLKRSIDSVSTNRMQIIYVSKLFETETSKRILGMKIRPFLPDQYTDSGGTGTPVCSKALRR